MDALEFLREVQRMHDYYTGIYHDCLKCPMADMPCRIPVTDDDNHKEFKVCFNCWNMPVEE